MEITNNTVQTVASKSNIIFSDTVVSGNCSIIHRDGSGLITLRGLTKQCRARYKVTYSGNIAVPNGGTVGEISMAITKVGEVIQESTMISTSTAINRYNNVSTTVFIDVPRGCCSQIAVQNISNQTISVANANLIIERVA